MKKHYPWLWFDADGTLFDYNAAEAAALKKTFHSLKLPFEEGYLDVYRRINHQLWQALEQQKITPAALQFRRFELLLEALQLRGSHQQMSSVYVEQLAICAKLMEGAYEVLQSLHGKCRLAILTNGLQAVQRSRLAHSIIRDFINEIIISEEIGEAKPQVAFFEIASARLGHPAKSDVLIIGDGLTSDMQGGVDYGIDTCWYNPASEPRPKDLPITYEIKHLRELLDILE
jgi:YjjG family noncanonical pyrimidine nucleotidase